MNLINNRYRILNELGKGRSKVFRCEDLKNDGFLVAIKILPLDVDNVEKEKFKDEYLTLRNLSHPNIVNVYDFGTVYSLKDNEFEIEDNSFFFTLELIDGNEFLDFIDEHETHLSTVTEEVLKTLFYIHESNFIYGDIKSENILISLKEEKPSIKFIDFGFVQNNRATTDKSQRGTAEYIAPEILGEEDYDKLVDLYSIGVLLYKAIYKKFPFSGNSELEVFKSILEDSPEFQQTNFDKKLIQLVQLLLNKNPDDRPGNALEALSNFTSKHVDILTNWNPAKSYVINNTVFSLINTYLFNDNVSQIVVLHGHEGSGKTSLVEEIYYNFEGGLIVRSNQNPIWLDLVEVVKNVCVKKGIDDKYFQQLEKIKKSSPELVKTDFRKIFTEIISEVNFYLIFDDFNQYDQFSIDIIKEILPLCLIHNIKVILTENAQFNFQTNELKNRKLLELNPFTENLVSNHLAKTFSNDFPIDEIKNLIIENADLMPGSINRFLIDLFSLGVLRNSENEIFFDPSKDKLKLLQGSQQNLYKIRIENLSEIELRVVQYLSAFNVNVSEKVLSQIIEFDSVVLENIKKNKILDEEQINNLSFTSLAVKEFIYSNVEDKKSIHSKISNALILPEIEFDFRELSRHLLFAENYKKYFDYMVAECEEAEVKFLFSYKRDLLIELLKINLSVENRIFVNSELSKTYFRLMNFSKAYEVTMQLLSFGLNEKQKREAQIREAGCLVETGKIPEGITRYYQLLETEKENNTKYYIICEIASAELLANKYSEAKKLCEQVITESKDENLNVAKAYNLLGIISFDFQEELDNSIANFQKSIKIYKNHNYLLKVLHLHVNIGSIFHKIRKKNEAFENWQIAIGINETVGSLDALGIIKMNLGVYFLEELKFDEALISFEEALKIFKSINSFFNEGLCYYNLAELNLIMCKYGEVQNNIIQSKKVFTELNDPEELLEVLFLEALFLFIMNSEEELKKHLESVNLLKDQISGTNKYETYLLILNSLLDAKKSDSEFDQNSVKLFYKIVKLDESRIKEDIFFIFIEYLNNIRLYKLSFSLLSEVEIMKQLKSDDYFNANLAIYKYQIANNESEYKNICSIDDLLNAFELIENRQITESTWKLTCSIAEAYIERGMFAKAKEFAGLTKGLINHLSQKISEPLHRKQYLEDFLRNESLEKIKSWEVILK